MMTSGGHTKPDKHIVYTLHRRNDTVRAKRLWWRLVVVVLCVEHRNLYPCCSLSSECDAINLVKQQHPYYIRHNSCTWAIDLLAVM